MSDLSTKSSSNPANRKFEALIVAAQRIVADQGIARLSLRNVAECAGVSTATVTHHLGAKDEILPRLIKAAKHEDEAFFAPWREMSFRLTSPSYVLAARAYSSWFANAHNRMVLLNEILQMRDLSPVAITALVDWIALHEAAWTEIGGAQRGHVISRMLIDEAAFSAALGASHGYILLRDLCFARLFQRDGAEAFTSVRDTMAPAVSLVESPPELNDVRSAIAEAAAIIVTEGGADRLNHRRVAERTGVAASSVVYHFGGREELMLAALTAVLTSFRKWVDGAASLSKNSSRAEREAFLQITERLVRATHAIGLGAMRYEALVPHAIDMRRRRGENIRRDQIDGLSDADKHHVDPLFCQVLSVASFGSGMLAMALGEDQTVAHQRVARDLVRLV